MLIAVALLALVASQGAAERPNYKDVPRRPQSYNGPGREAPEPADVTEVRIGYFGPADPSHPLGGTFWTGATQAVEEANREGGYKGKPFRLVAGWSENPWAGGVSRVVQMAYVDNVWGVIGSIDGNGAHLAEQIAAKALFPVIDPGSTDRTVNFANVPWLFSCLPSDREIAAALGRAVAQAGTTDLTVIRGTEHDARALSRELEKWFGEHRVTPKRILDYAETVPEVDSDTGVVVVLAPPADAARIVRALRSAHPRLIVFGGPTAARQSFVDAAGPAAEGVRVPVLGTASRAHPEWDYAAVSSYDAVRLMIAAIRQAGLNRARIRDTVQSLSGWQGASGRIEWDVFGRNSHPVSIGVISRGRIP